MLRSQDHFFGYRIYWRWHRHNNILPVLSFECNMFMRRSFRGCGSEIHVSAVFRYGFPLRIKEENIQGFYTLVFASIRCFGTCLYCHRYKWLENHFAFEFNFRVRNIYRPAYKVIRASGKYDNHHSQKCQYD